MLFILSAAARNGANSSCAMTAGFPPDAGTAATAGLPAKSGFPTVALRVVRLK